MNKISEQTFVGYIYVPSISREQPIDFHCSTDSLEEGNPTKLYCLVDPTGNYETEPDINELSNTIARKFGRRFNMLTTFDIPVSLKDDENSYCRFSRKERDMINNLVEGYIEEYAY